MNGSSLGVDANLIDFPEQQKAVVLFSNYGGGNCKEVIEGFVQRSEQGDALVNLTDFISCIRTFFQNIM